MPRPGGSTTAGVKYLAIYGACGGMLIVAMQFVEYRFLFLQCSVEV